MSLLNTNVEYRCIQNLPLLLTAKDLQKIGFSRSMAYGLLSRPDVPVLKIGSRRFVQREAFFEWLRRGREGANNV